MSSLIAVTLEGQLGNHLFQFALGRRLNPDGPVPLDDLRKPTIWLEEALRPGAFRLIGPREIWRLRQPPRIPRGRRALATLLDATSPAGPLGRWYWSRQYVERLPGQVDPDVLRVAGPIVLNGVFHSEGYFRDIADRFVADLRPPSATARQRAATLGATAAGRPTVAVVMRAGRDYQAWGWTQPLSWYRSAVAGLVARLGPCRFAVFSDISLAAQGLAALLAEHGPAEPVEGLTAVEQLHVIAAMDHVISADTSFGWWGAWLGDHRRGFPADRVVVVPDPWILPEYRAMAPARWLRHPSGADLAGKHRPRVVPAPVPVEVEYLVP